MKVPTVGTSDELTQEQEDELARMDDELRERNYELAKLRYKVSSEHPKKWEKQQLELIRGFEVPQTEPIRWDGRIDASTDTHDPFAAEDSSVNEPPRIVQPVPLHPQSSEEDMEYFKRREHFPFDESKAPTFVRETLSKLDKYNKTMRYTHAYQHNEFEEVPSSASSSISTLHSMVQTNTDSRMK
ncbi:Oidioi.mRNA.OKI2018_I69.chr1.g3176.t1.cds [Oikopleura dioica]|uniref:Oidioi.mRNA.OKI2018_I69.chr1.g3176.t1.cds n=1 Tax=Oikopleura dioica TaxID=34765 RepID=A0ABN7SX85_OIKDI|nr:Oidioi.mRNA.OKI2018_I69.chr1.g3176.t1.cds [Oikopleura dioica]